MRNTALNNDYLLLFINKLHKKPKLFHIQELHAGFANFLKGVTVTRYGLNNKVYLIYHINEKMPPAYHNVYSPFFNPNNWLFKEAKSDEDLHVGSSIIIINDQFGDKHAPLKILHYASYSGECFYISTDDRTGQLMLASSLDMFPYFSGNKILKIVPNF